MKRTLSVILCILLVLPLIPVFQFGAAAEDGTYYVVIYDYDSANKIDMIKLMRELGGISLADAKEFVENLPGVIVSGLSQSDLENFISRLTSASWAINFSYFPGNPPISGEIRYRLVLRSYIGDKLAAVNVIREATGLGLRECLDIVDAVPAVVLENTSYEKCLDARETLGSYGFVTEIQADPVTDDPIIGCGAGWYLYDFNRLDPEAVESFTPVYDPNSYLMTAEYANGFIYGIVNGSEFVFTPYADGVIDAFMPLGAVNSEVYALYNRTRALAYNPLDFEMYAAVANNGNTDIYCVDLQCGEYYSRMGTFQGIEFSDLTFDGHGNCYGLADNEFYKVNFNNFTYTKISERTISVGTIASITADVNTGELFCDYHYRYRDIYGTTDENDPNFYTAFDDVCIVDVSTGAIHPVWSSLDTGDLFGIPALTSVSDLKQFSDCVWIGADPSEIFTMNDPSVETLGNHEIGSYTLMDSVYFDGYVYGIGTCEFNSNLNLIVARYCEEESAYLTEFCVLKQFDSNFALTSIAYDYGTNTLVGLDRNNNLYDICPDSENLTATFKQRASLNYSADKIKAIAFLSDGSIIAATDKYIIMGGDLGHNYVLLVMGSCYNLSRGEITDVAVDPETDEIYVVTRIDRTEIVPDDIHEYAYIDRIYRLDAPSTALTFVREVKGDNLPYRNLSAIPDVYPLWVDGTRVTKANCEDILLNGTASYHPESNKLTITDSHLYTVTQFSANCCGMRYNGSAPVVYTDPYRELTVIVEGNNRITNYDPESRDIYGIWAAGKLSISLNDTSLNIDIGAAEFSTGIFAGSLSLTGSGSVNITTADAGFSTEGIVVENNLTSFFTNLTINAGASDHYSTGILLRSGYYYQVCGNVIAIVGEAGMSSVGIGINDHQSLEVNLPGEGSLYAKGTDGAFSKMPDISPESCIVRVGSAKSSTLSAWDMKTDLSKYGQASISASILWGDVNGDGEVTSKDLALLRKYLAGMDFNTGVSDVEVSAGADVNGDGAIKAKDMALLRKYFANYNFDTNQSTVVLGPQN